MIDSAEYMSSKEESTPSQASSKIKKTVSIKAKDSTEASSKSSKEVKSTEVKSEIEETKTEAEKKKKVVITGDDILIEYVRRTKNTLKKLE